MNFKQILFNNHNRKKTLRSKQAVKSQYFVDTELNVLEMRSLGNSQTTLSNFSTSLLVACECESN